MLGLSACPVDVAQTGMDTKTCCRCGETLPYDAEHFARDSRKSKGLAFRCRQCSRDASREWKASDKGKAAGRRWYYGKKGQAYLEVAKIRRRERAAAKRAAAQG
jgi:hypothetical protein